MEDNKEKNNFIQTSQCMRIIFKFMCSGLLVRCIKDFI